VSGTAFIEKGDAIDVAGMQGVKTKEVPFSVRPVDAGSKHEWTCNIGFLPYDWEMGHEEQFYFECYVPKMGLDDLEAAYMTGRVTNVRLPLDTTLWIHDFDWHTPPSGTVPWYLVPEYRQTLRHAPARDR
jgi:hypothetical protein